MSVTAVVPWRPGCPHRERAWAHVRETLEDVRGYEVVVGSCPDGPFNRAWAILDGAWKASNETLLVIDADVVGFYAHATSRVESGKSKWAIPFGNLHRLTEASTTAYLAGERTHLDFEEVHRGNETGTCVVIERSVLDVAPPDVRFVGWGQEDDAWQRALRVMVGPPWRGSEPLLHLWHPPQPRLNRTYGSREGKHLRRRYESAQGSKRLMSLLLAETDELRPRRYPATP